MVTYQGKLKHPQSSSNSFLKRVIMFAFLFPLIKKGVAYHTQIRKQNKILEVIRTYTVAMKKHDATQTYKTNISIKKGQFNMSIKNVCYNMKHYNTKTKQLTIPKHPLVQWLRPFILLCCVTLVSVLAKVLERA